MESEGFEPSSNQQIIKLQTKLTGAIYKLFQYFQFSGTFLRFFSITSLSQQNPPQNKILRIKKLLSQNFITVVSQ